MTKKSGQSQGEQVPQTWEELRALHRGPFLRSKILGDHRIHLMFPSRYWARCHIQCRPKGADLVESIRKRSKRDPFQREIQETLKKVAKERKIRICLGYGPPMGYPSDIIAENPSWGRRHTLPPESVHRILLEAPRAIRDLHARLRRAGSESILSGERAAKEWMNERAAQEHLIATRSRAAIQHLGNLHDLREEGD